jgi:hypothetical protein
MARHGDDLLGGSETTQVRDFPYERVPFYAHCTVWRNPEIHPEPDSKPNSVQIMSGRHQTVQLCPVRRYTELAAHLCIHGCASLWQE